MAESTIRRGITNEQVTALINEQVPDLIDAAIESKALASQLTGPGLSLNGTPLGSSFWKLGRLRVLIIAGILYPTANTVHTLGTISTGNRPVLESGAAYVPVVSGETKGYGRITVADGGQVSLISSFTGNQEITTVLTWIAEA